MGSEMCIRDRFDDTSSSILSEDNKSLAAAIPSQLDSLNAMLSEDAVHNGTTDWPSSFGKSSREVMEKLILAVFLFH